MRARTVLIGLILAVAACAQDAPQAASPDPSPTATPGASPTAEPFTGRCEMQSGGDDGAAMFLTDVEVASHGTFDRVVYTFEPREGQPAEVPFYRVEPVTPPLTEDGSGREIEVAGDAFLRAIIYATGVDLSGEEPREVYTGPERIEPEDADVIEEVRQAGDFENVLTWYLGLDHEACFEVRTLTDPVRIVVDVAAARPSPSPSPQ